MLDLVFTLHVDGSIGLAALKVVVGLVCIFWMRKR
jgi:hypothetical protein